MGGFITGSLTGPEVDVTSHHALERKTWISCSPGINNEGAGRVVMREKPSVLKSKRCKQRTFVGNEDPV